MVNLQYIQDVMFEIALQFHDFCETNNIGYSVAGGSMLGAIRHQDFIPWDDDFDVVIPRADFNKFLECWTGNLVCKYGEIGIIKHGDEGYFKSSTPIKLHLITTRVSEINEVEYGMPEFNPYGIFLDIFPADAIKKTTLNLLVNKHWGNVLQLKTQSNFHYKTFGFAFRLKLFPFKLIPQSAFDRVTKYFINRLLSDNGDHIIYGIETPFSNLVLPKEDFMPFEKNCKVRDFMFFGVNKPKKYLKQRFGDYMALPAEEDRFMHIVKIAKIQED